MKVLLVSVEPLFPAVHGGRVRTGMIASSLVQDGFHVRVVYPHRPGIDGPEVHPEVEQIGLPWAPASSLMRFRSAPWLGTYLMSELTGLQTQLDNFEPDFIYWSHSYLAAVGQEQPFRTQARHIVEFANIEAQRFLSLSQMGSAKNRTSAFFEYLKATRWERRLMPKPDLCVAISDSDGLLIRKSGGNAITVENALPRAEFSYSSRDAPILSVANWDYGPNRDGIDRFLQSDWPSVLKVCPHAELVLAGKGSLEVVQRHRHPRGVTGRGFVDELSELFASSSMFLAPARSGAGRQLKVAEALGNCRTVVGPSFLNRERRTGLPLGAIRGAKDLSAEISDVLENVTARHQVEEQIAAYAKPRDWAYETVELRKWMMDRMAK